MARKTVTYKVDSEGRDHGKVFLLTEMSAAKAESWAMRVLLALIANNVNMPDNYEELGMAGLAEVGLKGISGLKWEVAEPLLAEMLEGIEIIPDPAKTHVKRPIVESDIEEVVTRLKLRMEVFNLHVDFSLAAVQSIFPGKRTAAAGGNVSHTATSRRS